MRPLSLSYTGLRSYDTFGPVSFEDRSLVGILGDTGAGKSSILEALCVALYGKCSWSDRDVKDLIADGAPTISVDLTFRHDEHRWRVRRTFYTNTMPTTALLENLDTGARYDNIRPVDKAIVTMLRMDFTAFKSAVLLPQNRFATLLHATDRERTDLLKGIFGVDTVALVREFAQARRLALSELLQQAALARAAMLPDPAGESSAAAARAERAEQQTADLTDDITRLRELQAETAAAVTHAAEVTAALLAINAATDELSRDKIEALVQTAAATEDELATLECEATSGEQQATTQLNAAAAALAAADAAGTGPAQLASAAATLGRLPAESDAIRSEQERVSVEEQRLATERARLDTAAVDQSARERDAAQLTSAATAIHLLDDDVQNAVTELTSQISELLDAAAATAAHDEELTELAAESTLLKAGLPDLDRKIDVADDALTVARLGVEAAQRTEAAAIAAEHLHAGDQCPVCTGPIPNPYTPPPPADSAALSAAQTRHQDASDVLSGARSERESAERRRRELADAATIKNQEVQAARAALTSSLERVTAWTALATLTAPIDDVEWPKAVASTAPVVAMTVRDDLVAGVSHLDKHGDRDGQQRRLLLQRLLAPAHQYSADLRTAATELDALAATARAEYASETRALKRQETGYQREADAATDAEQRLAATAGRVTESISNLPTSIRGALPDLARTERGFTIWLAQVTDQHIARAQAVLDAARAAIAGHEHDRSAAELRLRNLAQTRSTASRRRDAEVATPLRQALSAYEHATTPLHDARKYLPDLPEPDGVPSELTTSVVRRFGQAVLDGLVNARTNLAAVKSTADATAERRRGTLSADLSAALSRIADSTQGSPTPAQEGATLLSVGVLDPLTDARGIATEQGRTARSEERVATDQIAHAATLDEAIAAGDLRRTTLDELYQLLAEGKFQTDLTERRTRALLGVASELFSRLSGGEFGYAEQFQVVARRTGVARSAKTLSGGETFLASLALALALVELYSRTAGRLGALFLDEGFGSLDVDTLGAALEVLRAETGGDKLVAVISHLHTVAEAVEDVLWVEKGSSGSVARWLTGEQIADLVRDDAAAGLLSLT